MDAWPTCAISNSSKPVWPTPPCRKSWLPTCRQLENITFDADSIQLPSPAGNLKLRIVERDEPKCIKLAGEDTPLPLYVWIQLLPEGDDACKMRVTVGAEVSLFMKPMVSKPLSQAAEGLANVLSLV